MNISPEKLLVIGILALLVLGPTRLPAAARTAGKMLFHLRSLTGTLQSELKEVLAEPQQALQHAVEEFGIKDLRTSVRDTISIVGGAATTTSLQPPPVPSAERVADPVPQLAQGAPAGDPPAPDDPALN